MAANVPMMDMGSARLGMSVAERFRRKMKITMMTRHTAANKVCSTSDTDLRMVSERSMSTSRFTDAGIAARNCGSNFLMRSTTSTVFAPGWRWTASTTARVLSYHAMILSFCTLSRTLPNCCNRTGLPLR